MNGQREATDDGWGLYVHVPWCRLRCPYCAFYVLPDPRDADLHDRFVDRVIAEVGRRSVDFSGPPRTVYLGGGTPSRLAPGALTRLLQAIVPPGCEEVTVEANPEDVTDAWAEAAKAAGVHRVSLGVQTLHPGHARLLGRARSPADAQAAVPRLRGLRSFSVDLMFGLHGQTLEDLDRDLDAVLATGAPHISLYGLTIEEGTGFERAAARGRVVAADEELWRAMYARIVDRLKDAGIQRYEVSNFARSGHLAIHNPGYWRGRPYLGVGPGAHSLLPDGVRTIDRPDLDRWMTGDVEESRELPDAEEAATDLLISAVRTTAGLAESVLAARTGLVPSARARERLITAGWIHDQPGWMILTDEGFFVADAVVAELGRDLVPARP